MKLYDLGLVIGRFQSFHSGHEKMIKYAMDLCERVVVFVGSSQKSGTKENPFSYIIREKAIELVFPVEVKNGSLIIRPLPDIGVGNNTMWGKYVLGVFEEEFSKQPDLYITGCEKERPSWFTNEIAPNMDELRISRKSTNVSATECRELLLEDKETEWQRNVPYQLHKQYKIYRNIIKGVEK